MRDVVKTNVKREQTSKRARRRKTNTGLYFFLVLIVVLGIGVLLSVTLLFNINKINIKGEVDYSNETVIKASGIDFGDNLVRLDAKAAEQKILSSMVYVEKADISKKYPDTLEITLEKCVPVANAEYDGGVLLLSPNGKILENIEEPQADIITVKGLEPTSFNLGEYITSDDENKAQIYYDIINALGKCKNSNVISIDITDKYNILINYDNRITFEAGNSNEIAYKVKLADTVLEDLNDNKKGIMVMVGANQISFRTENSTNTTTETEKPSQGDRIPIKPEDLPEGYTEPLTDETESDEEEYIEEDYTEEEYTDEEYTEEYLEDEYYDDGYSEEEYYDDGYYEDEY